MRTNPMYAARQRASVGYPMDGRRPHEAPA